MTSSPARPHARPLRGRRRLRRDRELGDRRGGSRCTPRRRRRSSSSSPARTSSSPPRPAAGKRPRRPVAAHAIALAQGQRSYYTAPIKAAREREVLRARGDLSARRTSAWSRATAASNGDAPIVCCTAEILANQALRHGSEVEAGLVVMDEFHYYADPPSGGWAWQVPLLELPNRAVPAHECDPRATSRPSPKTSNAARATP